MNNLTFIRDANGVFVPCSTITGIKRYFVELSCRDEGDYVYKYKVNNVPYVYHSPVELDSILIVLTGNAHYVTTSLKEYTLSEI